MIYPTVAKIFKNSRGFSIIKLLVAQAAVSRPRLRSALMPFLKLVSNHGAFEAEFYTANRELVRASFRLSDLASDVESLIEVGMGDAYRLNEINFDPELIVDGGGNIGLFAVSASKRWPSAETMIFEPLPENVTQIKENFRLNDVPGKIFPFCLGKNNGEAVFYRRTANTGGLAAVNLLSYASQTKTEVRRLSEFLTLPADAKCLIKLDIEGAEVDVMDEFLKVPRPNTVIVGEFHFPEQKQRFLDIVRGAGWKIDFWDEVPISANFLAKP